MSADLISLLMADLVLIGMTFAAAPQVAGRVFWPRCVATVVDRKVYSGYAGTLLVRFVLPEGKAVEADITNTRDDPLFLLKHPVGSPLRICYKPRKPCEASLPASVSFLLGASALLLVINGGFLYGALHSILAP